jgi:hypothetical protein
MNRFGFTIGAIKGGGSAASPAIVSAVIEDAAPTVVVLTFDKTVTGVVKEDFTLAGKTISTCTINDTVVSLTVTVAYSYGDVVTLDYVKNAGNVADFSNMPVINNISAVPFIADALLWLDGTIVEDGGSYYFKDKSGNDRDFLITDYDWADDYNGLPAYVFPWKTKATISAPIGDAALIAADTGNFFYDSGGTPIALRPQFFFSNVNYENQIYSREINQTIFPLNYADESLQGVEIAPAGLKDIVMYSSARTGADITTAATYFGVPFEVVTDVLWVSKSGNDTSGDGSKTTPYLTIQKAITITNKVNKTIYVKNGLYSENGTNGNLYIYWRTNTVGTLTLQGLGGVSITNDTAGTYKSIIELDQLQGASIFNFKNLHLEGKANANNYNISNYNLSGSATISCDKVSMYVQGGGLYGANISPYSNTYISISKSCLRNKTTETCGFSLGSNVIHTYSNGLSFSIIKNGDSVTYCKIDAARATNTTNVNFTEAIVGDDNAILNIKYNIFWYGYLGFQIKPNTKIITTNLLYNKFLRKYTNTTSATAIYFASGATGVIDQDVNIKYNYVLDLIDQAITTVYLMLSGSNFRVFDISYNFLKSTSAEPRDHIKCNITSSVSAGCKANYNHIETESTVGVGMISHEGAIDDHFIGVELIGNYVRGYRLNNPNAANPSHHGFLVRGTNCIVKDNYVAYNNLGFVLKTNNATNSSYVFENNIAYNNDVALTTRAFNTCVLNNNTFVVESSQAAFIDLYNQDQETLYLELYNNIFYCGANGAGTPTFIVMRTATYAEIVFEKNVIKCPNGDNKLFYVNGAYVTLAQAISDGVSLDNVTNVTPSFNDITTGKLWLNSKLSYGKDLGASRKTRLASSTDWLVENDHGIYVPDINTIDDNDAAPKQVGAYGL